ncbi:MAG: hypothetical protein WDA68_12085 [Phycisphaerae bacterium]|jgi:hypothetical protein
MKKISILIVLLGVLISCNKNDDFVEDQILTETSIQLDEMFENEVLKMMDYVKSSDLTTRALGADDTIDGQTNRKYVSGLGDCYNVRGNCLPDLIVTPQQPTTRAALHADVNDKLKLWNSSKIGIVLSNEVKNKNLNFNYIANSNGLFLIYSNPNDPTRDMVIPLK